MSACVRVESELAQTAQLCQHLLQIVVQLKSTLCRLCRLQRMQTCKLRKHAQLLVDFGVILHGAAAQGIEAGVYTEILVADVGKVAHCVEFAHFGQIESLFALQICRDSFQGITLEFIARQFVATASGT